ncbi:sulfatase-like hydrolase/transferase [Maribellus maritimus]|uniref:sulfatase-like hydrolase/transferase n=1 Tax=Maribellus maritimus TaxID=2870838 RepID=UPI001EEB5B10|nr:sulfatase-like hydrolase/transferase [Maribellus maritimus]MCG6191008.1 sulfatase-like hydrolase/transferase [Maribellus maritimus]
MKKLKICYGKIVYGISYRRVSFLVRNLIALFLLVNVSSFANANSKRKPNILYIFTDDQSIRTLSCYPEAHPWIRTPNIDKLAEKGVRFSTCYTGAKCVPSRGNALTGMLQHNYDKSTTYWPVEFRKQGYYTGMIGKWHWNVPRHKETWDWSAVYEHYLPGNSHNYYWDQSLRINGDTLLKLEKYSTDAYTDMTLEFLKERAQEKDKPWYFWLCYGGVHGPHTPADRHIGSYENTPEVKNPKDIFAPRPDKPEHMVNLETFKKDPVTGKPMKKNRTLDSWVKQYNEAVRSIDEGIGKIMTTLEETGQLENTIVVFSSDQGYAWGQHGYNLKIAPYDANLLAPLIFVRPNDFPQNKVCNIPVNGTDIIATFHSLCNIQPSQKLDGRDLTELIYKPKADSWNNESMVQLYTGLIYGNDTIKSELEKAHKTDDWSKFIVHRNTGTKAWMMLQTGKYKYVRYIYKDYIEELYDLENDPEELTNLAVKLEYKVRLRKMREQLLKEFRAKNCRFLDLLPEPVEKNM